MEIEPFKVDLYIRVSTDKQADHGDSLEEQETELKKYCEYRGFQIHNVLVEKGRSGGNTNRPEYQRLIRNVKAKKINAVVVKKLDRLSRSLLDFEQLMSMLLENDIEFMSLKESFDTSTAMGKAMLRVALVFAQLEREQTSERITDVMAYRASQGLYNGGVTPIGYTNVNKELVPYPKEKQMVEFIYRLFLENKSTTKTARLMNDTGYRARQNKPWDTRLVQKVLQNPVCIGKVRWKGDVFQGIHQPIIPEQQFNEVQDVFERRKYLKSQNNTKALLQGIIYCGYCLSPMTPSHTLNWQKSKYYYYRCTSTNRAEKNIPECQFKSAPMKGLDKHVIEILLSLSQEFKFKPLEMQIIQFNEKVFAEQEQVKSQIQLTEQQIADLKNTKDKYLDSLITGDFSSQERQFINNKLKDIELEEKQLKGLLYKLQFEYSSIAENTIDITEFKQLMICFKTDRDSLSPKELKEFMATNIKEVTYYPDKVSIQFRALPWSTDFPIQT